MIETNRRLLEALKAAIRPCPAVDFAVCPPFPYLPLASELLKGSPITIGAQNVSEHDSGAYTGEVAGTMLRDMDCRFVIVGHSERRTLYGESDVHAALKMQAALRHGLTPIVCIGESLEQRDRGETEQVLERQMKAILGNGAQALSRSVIAYEPIWAIGTGRTATPEQAQRAHSFVRSQLAAQNRDVAQNVPLLYGGSVKASNAAELFAMPNVDGGLVGGASLVAEEFVAIWRAGMKAREGSK